MLYNIRQKLRFEVRILVLHQIANSYGNYNYNCFIYVDDAYAENLAVSHFHSNYELIYAMDGEAEINLNGRSEILVKGELMLISPFAIHSLVLSRGARTWVGVFSEDFIMSFAEKNRHIRYSKFTCDAKVEVMLRDNLFFEGQPEHYMMKACLYMVIGECVKNASAYTAGKGDGFITSVTQYISEHLTDDIKLVEIAEALGYEYHYFSSLFHKAFSMNFKSFINIFRFDSACKMLSNKKTDISAVCEACGFGSVRNFNRVFRQLSGITPSEYKKMIKK